LTGCLHSSEKPSEESDTGKVPEDIEGLRLWLHPDSGTVTGDGGVETWRDDSGNGYDLTQEETGLQPSLVEDAVEGNPALRFDGEEDHLLREDALGIPDEGARTFVVVSRLTDLGARSPFLTQGTFGSSGGGSNFYGPEANTFRTSGERFGLYLVSVAKDSELATDTNYKVHVHPYRRLPQTFLYRGVNDVLRQRRGGSVRRHAWGCAQLAVRSRLDRSRRFSGVVAVLCDARRDSRNTGLRPCSERR